MFDFLFKKRERLPLPYKREIHCHIIPGVDDGSALMSLSIDYLKALQDFGLQRVVFTPHHAAPNYLNDPSKIQPLYDTLTARAKAAGSAVVPEGFSFEYRMDSTFKRLLRKPDPLDPNGQLRPFMGNYLLIECPWTEPDDPIEDLVAEIKDAGFHPILAHPERYLYWALDDHEAYRSLKRRGLDFQCNLLSFAGYYGDTIRKTAQWMLSEGYVDFLGSDLHNEHQIHLIDEFLRSKRYASIRHDLIHSAHNDRL